MLCWELHWEEQGQRMEGSYYPSLLGTGEAAPGIACSVLGPVSHPQSKKDMEECGEGPAEGY